MTSPTNEQQRVDVLHVMDMLASADYGVSYSDAALQQQAREARAAMAELIESSSRTVRAFISLGVAPRVAAILQARQECEAALIAQEDALANAGAQP